MCLMQTIFVTVNAANYQGCGVIYTNILFDQIRRNISENTPFRFEVFSDTCDGYDEGIVVRPLHGKLEGWWNKLYLFKDGLFAEGSRIIFMDLDTCIVSSLDEYMSYNGPFAILSDFYRPHGLQSSIMLWKPSSYLNGIWQDYLAAGCPIVDNGDQGWIEKFYIHRADIIQGLYPNHFVSFKEHTSRGLPQDAHVVVFHGQPKPHQITDGWVPYIWIKGGGSILHQQVVSNTNNNVVLNQVRATYEKSYEHLADQYDAPSDKSLCIVGGGPSLKDDLPVLRELAKTHIIWALNNSYKYLADNGIYPHCHVMLDARPENAEFVPASEKILHLYASQCHSDVFARTKGKVIIWNSFTDGILGLLDEFKLRSAVVGNATSVGLSAVTLSKMFGFTDIHLYGFDSSYLEDANHAYAQSLNDGEKRIEVICNDQKFSCAPWMATQVEDFKRCINEWIKEGLQITVHGYGLLPYVARLLAMPPESGIVKKDDYWWPRNDYACRQVCLSSGREEIPRIIEYCKTRDVCVQAGGNVGIWPLLLADKFNYVHTFEPDQLNFECLVKNCEHIPHMTATNCGLGDSEENVELSREHGNCGAHFVHGTGPIPITTIDSFEYPVCNLIILDIEGYEMKALKGAAATIKRCQPVIMVEEKGLGKKYGIEDGAIEIYLASLGYSVAKRLNNDVIYIPHS